MATASQITANLANAQKSTGPKTAEGKAASSRNRLSHGFASNTTIIPGEDPNEYRGLVEDFMSEHQPATVTEQVLVEKMAQQQWLSLRALRLQGEAFVDHMVNGRESILPKDFGLLIRYQTSADRAFHRAHNELVKTQKERKKSEIGFVPQTFGEEAHPMPAEPPKAANVVPISSNATTEEIISTFTAADLDFKLCPEAVEFFKKAAAK